MSGQYDAVVRGVLLAGGRGTRLGPASAVINKHLLPVFDKPLIYYPLSTLMLSGIRDLVVVTGPSDLPPIQHLLGSGGHLGVHISYVIQEEPLGVADGLMRARSEFGDEPVTLVLGDNVFHGAEFGLGLSQAYTEGAAGIYGVRVPDPSRYAVAEIDPDGRLISLVEKPEVPRSPWVIPGLYVFPPDVWKFCSQLQPSSRGEFEIVDVLTQYLDQDRLNIRLVSRASFWTDAGTPRSLLDAANHIATLTSMHGELIASPEEIAFRQGWIDEPGLKSAINRLDGSEYAEHLRACLGSR